MLQLANPSSKPLECIVCPLIISVQKLVLISCRVTKTYVSISDSPVSYAPHNSYVCVTAGHSDMSKFTEGSSLVRIVYSKQ